MWRQAREAFVAMMAITFVSSSALPKSAQSSNFGQFLLGCIKTKICENQSLIFQHLLYFNLAFHSYLEILPEFRNLAYFFIISKFILFRQKVCPSGQIRGLSESSSTVHQCISSGDGLDVAAILRCAMPAIVQPASRSTDEVLG